MTIYAMIYAKLSEPECFVESSIVWNEAYEKALAELDRLEPLYLIDVARRAHARLN